MKNKAFIAIVASAVILLAAGCSNYRELRDITFISGMGIDYVKEKKRYEVTFQAFAPSSFSGSGSIGSVLYTSQGRTISEAARMASKKFSRIADYSQVSLVVLGEKLSRRLSLNFIFDVFERDAKIRTNIPVLIARKNSAKEVLSVVPGNENPVQSIIGKIRNASQTQGENGETMIYQIINQLASKGIEPAIDGISVINSNDPSKAGQKETKLNGTGIIRKGKLVAWMDGSNAKSIFLLTNKIRQTNEAILCSGNRYTSVRITDAHSTPNIKVKNGVPQITIKVRAFGVIDEMLCNANLMQNNIINKFEKEAAFNLKNHISEGIKEAQKQKSDVYGFGELLHRGNFRVWKNYEDNWGKTFAKAKIKINVTVILHGTNMRIEPYPYKR
ncbi:Ger(x)C family spore germination protein [Peribacillus kribbensis]|uniref:Ger(x)C family spore germination protein n=1 Tax=Peribacillus kribbensis TaxID=356658 RepID=UPI0003F90A38|nr:Ger(x)C family spore germination protein [Peribacillus kribbensis]